jgi:FKBP12-rapamycin complex-associated protein
MLDRASGKLVHIDFGDCFEIAMIREKFAEKVPFRLTRMLRKAMEVTGIDGTFRITCEHVMDVLRKNRDSLMAVLETFVHDPLLNWRLLDNNNVTVQPDRTIRAVEVINRVREKLTGNDFHREQPVDIPTQVELLIKQATSHENLCQYVISIFFYYELCISLYRSYSGWCPFW